MVNNDEELLKELTSKFTAHASFVAESNLFGINHYAGAASYDVTHFVEKDSDLLDSAFVSLLRNSSDGFVSKFLSGPSLAAERHNKDDQIIVQAQVSSRPLRNPSPVLSPNNTLPAVQDEHPHLDPGKTYPITTQLNFTLSEIFTSLERAKLWTISCI
jgi:chitin synthase